MNAEDRTDSVTNNALVAFERMREEAKQFPKSTFREINKEIAAARQERKQS